MSQRLASGTIEASRFHIQEHLAHNVLAEACLGVVIHPDVTQNTAANVPLLKYADGYWVEHVRSGGMTDRVEAAMRCLFDPEMPYFARWIRNHDNAYTLERCPKHEEHTLYYASLGGWPNIVKFLITVRGQDVNAQTGARFSNALQAASAHGHLEVVRLLLSEGAEVNMRGGRYLSALAAAVHSGQLGIVRLLLDAGADADANMQSDAGGYGSPLVAASTSPFKNLEIVRLLLDAGADVNARCMPSKKEIQ